MDEITQPTPAPKAGKHHSVMLGALLGAVALAATIVGVSTVAGAQDAPTTDDTATALSVGDDTVDDEMWAPFEKCMAEQLGDLWEEPSFDDADLDAIEFIEPTEEDWAALDAAWEAADAACVELLPESAQIELAAFEAFDQCLADAGVLDESFGPAVHIETGSGFQFAVFGDIEGSITITGDSDGVVMSTDGGVTLLDEADLDAEWEAIDAAHSACEDLLPEGAVDGDIFFGEEIFED